MNRSMLSIKEKGEEAEFKFMDWLNKHNIPYWYIQQDFKTYSPALKKLFGVKRPDFMILLPNLGFILVDVKNTTPLIKDEYFTIDFKDVSKFSSFQRQFNLHTWFALSNEDCDYKTWYWIPVSKILGEAKDNSWFKKEGYFKIHPKQFIPVDFEDSIDKLFSKFFIESFKNES